MIVVCARESPRSAIISARSRKLSLYRRYQRTQSTMISWSKCRPLKSRPFSCALVSSVVRPICQRLCCVQAVRTRAAERMANGEFANHLRDVGAIERAQRDDAVVGAQAPWRSELGPRGREDE